jgi:reactive intermediate/imine deaminase
VAADLRLIAPRRDRRAICLLLLLGRRAIAIPKQEAQRMSREIIRTDRAPAAIGTYSQAVRAGATIYLSGQIPLDPKTMELVAGDRDAQIRRVLDNLSAVAEAAGGTLADVVKLNVFLTDLNDFALVNQIMREYFAEPFPARAAVGVAALPKGAAVEMDAVMVIHD